MYDDLARTQEPPLLERLVVTSVVPSLLLTALLHFSDGWERREPPPDAFVTDCDFLIPLPPVEEPRHGLRVPDVYVGIASVLAVEWRDWGAPFWEYGDWMSLYRRGGAAPEYPEALRRLGVQGRTVVEAVVDTLGRVERSSLVAVASTDLRFGTSAQQGVAAMRFEPFRVDARAMRVRISLPIDFRLR